MGYHGPGFSGVKKDFNVKSLKKPDIYHVLERSLDHFNKKKPKVLPSTVRISSRTDIGVHATRNTFTFNTVSINAESQLLSLKALKMGLNQVLQENKWPL
jgi:tRNA pseudouridine(38-40) synthase